MNEEAPASDKRSNKFSEILTRRPAEAATGTGALAILIGYLLGIDDATVLVSLAVVLGAVPAAVTWVIGLLRDLRAQETPPVR